MKSFSSLAILLGLAAHTSAFAPGHNMNAATSLQSSSQLNAYVPDGLTADQYQRIRKQDQQKMGKDLGRVGPRGFKSRSMQAWQEAKEQGLTGHSFAPLNYKQQLQDGTLKPEDVPYMVRGGSWDNSDVAGGLFRQIRKQKWLKADREYANGGYKKEQSVSILGSGPGFDWTGNQKRDTSVRRLFPGLS